MSDDEEQQSKPEGDSVWTSYSDLFMTVAVLFLILFVFSILQSGIVSRHSQMERDEILKYAEGVVPPDVEKASGKQFEKIEDSMEVMSDQKKALVQALANLKQFAQSIEVSRTAFAAIQDDHTQKNQMLTVANESIVKQKKLIAKVENENAFLSKVNHDLSAQVKQAKEQLATHVNKLASEREKSQALAVTQQRELVAARSEITQVKQALKKVTGENKQRRQEVDKLNQEYGDLNQRFETLTKSESTARSKLAEVQKLRQQERAGSEKLSARMEQLAATVQKLQTEMKETESRNQALQQELAANRQQTNKSQREIESLKGALAGKDAELSGAIKTLATRDQEIQSFRASDAASKNQIARLQSDVSHLNGELDQLRKGNAKTGQLTASSQGPGAQDGKSGNDGGSEGANDQGGKSGIGAMPAPVAIKAGTSVSGGTSAAAGGEQSVTVAKKAPPLPSNIVEQNKVAEKVVATLTNDGVQARHNEGTGGIILNLDNTIYFDKDSARLKDAAKVRIRQLMPKLLSILKEDPQLKDKDLNMTITGHASPYFRRQPVDPADREGRAYHYNLDLSQRRAEAVRDFIMSAKSGEFRYKNEINQIINVDSRGYSEPIALSPGQEEGLCGRYDCEKSQRIEILLVPEQPSAKDQQKSEE